MKRTRDNWLVRGLEILTTHGPEHLKIDRLCRHLQVTKGSFYHHFGNRADYIDALLDHWQRINTEQIIAEVDDIGPLEARSGALDLLACAADSGPERAIRGWSQYEPLVADRVAEVDRQRVDYLCRLIGPQLPDPSQTELIAKLAYAHFVGVQQLGHLIDGDQWQAMNQLLRQTLTNRDH
ncbi:TetR/AcrR family transcriptional regulator [Marinobacterium arenosum]|uniref:TetR/AcrR family transcriptional regulator n=1 Tax=Marinobacterium arenosum TaxID=2862496 RepID=UPI001C97C9B1|nr:TetR/AcrR family transcriptional regulator [Marinobacterium arenosum]MBY4675794.1 TetR/AcrR family transcriptional regulator [Marinobacterium arenosum]